MPIFDVSQVKLEIIPENPLNLEKKMEKLVESNMNTIFGIKFVTSEFQLNDLRVDSLGYDLESNSFVIFEYKRDKNFVTISDTSILFR